MPNLQRMSRRLILRDHVKGADIRAFADATDWTFVAEIDSDRERGIFYEVKWSTADGGSVHYVLDEFVNTPYMVVTPYVVVANDDPDTADAILSRIGNGLAVWSLDEMIHDCYIHAYPAGWAKSLLRLGIGAPLRAHEEVLEHVLFSAGHKDAPVRRAALWAMVYTAWPEFKDALAGLAQDDDPQVADEARRALELFVSEGL